MDNSFSGPAPGECLDVAGLRPAYNASDRYCYPASYWCAGLHTGTQANPRTYCYTNTISETHVNSDNY